MCVISEREKDALGVLAALCGLSLPDSGSVKTKGKVHLVSKNAPIPSFMTADEYFDMIKKVTGASELPELTKEIALEYGRSVIGTLDDLDRYYVALSASLIGAPEAVAIAYPFDGVPLEHRETLNGFLDEISDAATVIYTSFHPSLCRDDELILALNAGKCVGYGNTRSIFDTESQTLVCKVKGNVKSLDLDSFGVHYEINESASDKITEITFSDDKKELREGVKKMIAEAGLALISMKGESDTLKKLLDTLSESEAEEKEALESDREPKKLSSENISFSDEEENDDDTEAVSDESRENKKPLIGFYSDDEEEDDSSDESTLFSDVSEEETEDNE